VTKASNEVYPRHPTSLAKDNRTPRGAVSSGKINVSKKSHRVSSTKGQPSRDFIGTFEANLGVNELLLHVTSPKHHVKILIFKIHCL
jgi:hypothetical protein